MLEKTLSKQILDFVRIKPRTIQEIAFLIKKNWRTADRYVEILSTETGFISTRTFREGSRGALKLVYWNSLESNKGTAYQERLLQKILNGKHKEDFSAFDIYQFVPANKREAYIEDTEFSSHPKINYNTLLQSAQQQILLFSGNLSWLDQGAEMLKTIQKIAANKIHVKILTRVDITSKEKIKKVLSINEQAGWDSLQIRHCQQPLRALIIDDKFFTIKEIFTPIRHKELSKNVFLFYRIEDPEWINWTQKIFWHLWEQSIDAQTRLDALATLQAGNNA